MIIVNDLEKSLELDREALTGLSGGRHHGKGYKHKKRHYKKYRHYRFKKIYKFIFKHYEPRYPKKYVFFVPYKFDYGYGHHC